MYPLGHQDKQHLAKLAWTRYRHATTAEGLHSFEDVMRQPLDPEQQRATDE